MDFELSEAQEILRRTVRRLLAEAAPVRPFVRAALDDPRGHDAALWSRLAALGLGGLLVPEAHGGSGLGMIELGVVCEELGRALVPGPFLASALAAGLIGAVATTAEQAELLPELASGERIATWALEEPGGALSWTEVRTRARRRGDGASLTGVKHFVPDALGADLLLVVAREEPRRTFGVYAVETAASGVAVAPSPLLDGTRKLGRVELADASARRLGAGDAREAVAATLDRARVALAADALGAAVRAHELALDHARRRVQFGRPIGSFQAVQHLLVDMLRDLELARAGIYYALWAADAAAAGERHRAATMAKAFASARLPGVAASAIQIFGGIGFTWEHDIHLFYRRILSMQALLGDESVQLDELARMVVDTPVGGSPS